MYKHRTRASSARVKRCKIPLVEKTKDEDLKILLPSCRCNCEVLKKILNTVPTPYDYITSYRFRYGTPRLDKVYVIPAANTFPDETVALNEAAKRFGCRIKFVIHDTKEGIMRIETL